MYLSQKIKELRNRDGLSQEALAERIYVTRQTISNWETERSYPDVQSLLLLSVLFNVSLDELVKGDINTMKTELDGYKMNAWALVMLICFAVGVIISVPMVTAFGLLGAIPSLILILATIPAAAIIESIKKKHNVETYSEILSFIEGTPLDAEKVAVEKSHQTRSMVFKLLGSAAVGLALAGMSVLLNWLIFG